VNEEPCRWRIKKASKHLHSTHARVWGDQPEAELLLLSDLHFDSPHSNHELLRNHLEEARRRRAGVVIIGDFYDIMQSRHDPRRSKGGIRPEHSTDRYIDSVRESAVEFLTPFAPNLLLISPGNHEQAIRKQMETDVLHALVADLNRYALQDLGLDHRIHTGRYGGFLKVVLSRGKDWAATPRRTFSLAYYHGKKGGNAPVTGGTINMQRRETKIVADFIVTGHTHNRIQKDGTWKAQIKGDRVVFTPTEHIQLGTYKLGDPGWLSDDVYASEREFANASPGGVWLKFLSRRKQGGSRWAVQWEMTATRDVVYLDG